MLRQEADDDGGRAGAVAAEQILGPATLFKVYDPATLSQSFDAHRTVGPVVTGAGHRCDSGYHGNARHAGVILAFHDKTTGPFSQADGKGVPRTGLA